MLLLMRVFILFLTVLLSSFVASAQIQDDFSDGDFTNNPNWSGDDTQFKISSTKKLQLNSSGADTSYLSTANTLLNNTEWRFYIKQSFNSSSNNHSRIYLISDQADLKSSLNGYYIQFGSTQDDICLYRQDGNTLTKIISGTSGNTGNSVNEFTLKVTRDASGNWELFSDASAGNNFQSEGSVNDNIYTNTSYFGFWCKYTTSNSTKFYFDNVYVGTILVDTVPPVLMSIKTLDANHIDLYFNEALDSNTTNYYANYTVNNGFGNPTTAQRDANDYSIVHLYFWNPFVQGTLYTLTASNIKDLKGNMANPQQKDFGWNEIQLGDVVINEIMADPSPRIGLPEWEYIELYNNTILPVSLNNWTLQIGKTKKQLPDSTIAPHSYVIIGHQNAQADLSSYGSFIGLSSFSLTNSRQQLILLNDDGRLIHQINYTSSWYQDNNKADGGWSLEQIDPNNPCGCYTNWKASTDNNGGTPGSKNSVDATNPDQTKPYANRVSIIDSTTIRVHFSEPMDSASISDISIYEVDNFGKPISVKNDYPSYRSIALHFANVFQKKTLYDLSIQAVMKDCVGNNSTSNHLRFGIPEQADSNDLIINEILFDPQSPGVDYIEIVNRTDKIFDLKDLRLANWDEENQNYKNVKELTEDSYLIYSYGYYVFSTNSSIIKQQYLVSYPEWLIEIPSMISMSNSEGNVILITSTFKEIDRLDYNEDMHFALLQNTKGISLERVNPDQPTNDKNNWHSAATTNDSYSQSADFAGTPTGENSQFSSGSEFSGEVWVRNNQEIFSPDNDGRDDLLLLDYKFETTGNTANIRVYDMNGKLIRNLMNNELLATKGTLSWDGLDNDNHKANVGVYIIYVEIFNLNGDVKHFKLKAVLASYL
jgi:hypothetical protein